jgi:hypothetical protein
MSQVFISPIEIEIPELFGGSDLIILASPEFNREVIYKKTFPKETHHKQSEENEFIRQVHLVKIEKVIKGDRELVGQTIKVLEFKAYSEEDIQAYHEKGIEESPAIQAYKKRYPYEMFKDSYVAFLQQVDNPYDSNSKIYQFYNDMETTDGVPILKDLLMSFKP